MWTSDEFPVDPIPSQTPARGKIIDIDGTRALSFFIVVEPFVNGARPVVQVILRHDRRREVTFRVFAMEGSPPMQACVLTATMGNYARLRRLHLRDTTVQAGKIWPDFKSKEPWGPGFAPAKFWSMQDLPVRDGMVEVRATSNEANPSEASYAPSTPDWWQYRGLPSVQYWKSAAADDVQVRVNGRYVYWGSDKPIPGGVAFENFELHAPFKPGQEFIFGVEPMEPSGR
jgi:hypothetical protein